MTNENTEQEQLNQMMEQLEEQASAMLEEKANKAMLSLSKTFLENNDESLFANKGEKDSFVLGYMQGHLNCRNEIIATIPEEESDVSLENNENENDISNTN